MADIDSIVKQVRFDGWQGTAQGEREVKQALRRALLKYKLHTDQDLFDKFCVRSVREEVLVCSSTPRLESIPSCR